MTEWSGLVGDGALEEPCDCINSPLRFSARECYELRTYGYSPVLRDAADHSEGMYMLVDPDGECDCECHIDEDEDYADPVD